MDGVYILLIVLTATVVHVAKTKKNWLRVYHGFDDKEFKYPFVVCLVGSAGDSEEQIMMRICSGTLIKANWVLSAAHCLVDEVKNIQFGNMSLSFGETDAKSKVLKKIPHPMYFEAAARYDIGLLLVTPVPMSKYGRVSAVDFRTLLGHAVEYAGFGSTFLNKRKTRYKLIQFLLDIVRPLQIGEAVVKSCEEPFEKSFLCLSHKCSLKQSPLPGDSGGPLFCEHQIVGVACAITLDYSGQSYTPVSPYLSWIQTVVLKQA